MTYAPIPDISNYTVNYTQDNANYLRDQLGVKKVLIQAVNPPAGYPVGKTQEQIEISINTGFLIGIYIYHWYENYAGWLEDDINLFVDYQDHIDDLLLDIEDVLTGRGWSVQQRVDSINGSFARLDQLKSSVGRTRRYHAKWYDEPYLPGVEDFADRDSWVAQYDGVKDASVVTPWTGIGPVVLKQYVGTTDFGLPKTFIRSLTTTESRDIYQGGNPLALRQAHRGHFRYGNVSGLDLSVPSDNEYLRMTGTPSDPCQEYKDGLYGMINSLGWLGKDAMTQSGVLKSTSKYVKAYLDYVRAECDAHGIEHY